MQGDTNGPRYSPTRTSRPNLSKRTWIALGCAGLVLAASIGAAMVLHTEDQPKSYLEIYITDLPADFSHLDIKIAAVEFGSHRIPLALENQEFDLLALRGPADALRIASGHVPAGKDQTVHIRFESARLELDRKPIDVSIPDAVLTVDHDYKLKRDDTRSVLFDIDVEKSLIIDGPTIFFEPVVKAVYVVAQGGPSAATTDRTLPGGKTDAQVQFQYVEPEQPRNQILQDPPRETTDSENPFQTLNRGPATTTTVTATKTASPTTMAPAEDDDNDTAADLLPDQTDQYSTVPDHTETMLGYLLRFAPNTTDLEAMESDIEEAGGEILYRFESVPAVYVGGQEVHIASLARAAWAEHVEPVVPISLHLASSKPAVRAHQIQSSLQGITDSQGRPIDGRGVGVAVVDSGIDGLHPDLTHFLLTGDESAVRANFKVFSNNLADMPNTDTSSGHGTHVAGIVAGRGTKDPSLKGVAPGATLYGFGTGELANTFWTNQAFDWIIAHGHLPARGADAIRIVTNSWGTTGPYDPDSLTTRLVNQMVAKGIVVVFSAGNAGGDGLNGATTSAECRIPTPGVICVSWYDDQGGSRDGIVHLRASRGQISDPATWPDVSAPGSSIRSARTPFGWVTGVGLTDYYVSLDGSSMAAPHVAGAAALMLQANPNLSPAQVESIIESTAYKYADKGAYSASGSHYAKGHGLLDAHSAVQAAKTT